jgi:hypothetical protein
MNNKSMQILVAIIALLVIVAFASTKLQFKKDAAPAGAVIPDTTSEKQADSSEQIDRLETDLMVADVLYLKAKMVAMGKAATFMDTMARKIERRASASEYDAAKDEQQQTQLEFMIASEKTRSLYLALKKLDPNNKTLVRIRDAGRVKGGVSPYDD